jgi:hypothetical protein
MFCHDYEDARNPDGTKKTIDTLRPEFITGSNASLSRMKNKLIFTWNDPYPDKQHEVLQNLLDKLNEESQKPIPFLGGLKLRFEITPPRSEKLHNMFKRQVFEF